MTVRFPPGTIVDPAVFDLDPRRRNLAVPYWAGRFAALGDPALATSGSASFADTKLQDAVDTLARHQGGRDRIAGDIARLRPKVDGLEGIVTDRTALLTTVEIAHHVGIDGGHAGLLAAVGNLATARRGTPFVAARELADLLVRWRFSGQVGAAFGLPRSTVLAFWRQESALCVSPPSASWPHAPLVATADRAARTPSLPVTGTRRDGFDLSWRADRPLDAADPLLRAALALKGCAAYGLDQVSNPLLHSGDEIRALVDEAGAGTPDWALAFVAGLAGARAEAGPGAGLPTLFGPEPAVGGNPVEHLVEVALAQLAGLQVANPVAVRGDVAFLAPDDGPADTLRTLATGVELLSRRSSLRTLLAWVDRPSFGADVPVLDPAMTYLRFHCSDALFASYLIRVGAQLGWLARLRERGSEFAAAVERVSDLRAFGTKLAAIRDNQWRGVVANRTGRGGIEAETTWRHIGVIDAFHRVVPSPAPTPPKELRTAADGARALVRALIDHPGSLAAIAAFLLRTPVSRIMELHAGQPSLLPSRTPAVALNPLVKTHSYELLRTAFHDSGFDA